MSVEEGLPVSAQLTGVDWLRAALVQHWPLALGFAIMAVPTVIRLAQQVWPMEIGAHGPIVLATGIWLLFHVGNEMRAEVSRPNLPLGFAGCLLGMALYAFGRPYDLIFVEALGVYVFFLAAASLMIGMRPLVRHAFPFLYLAFLVPIPGWIIDAATMPLQMFVSWASTTSLEALGYPIARTGVVIVIAQYRLLVEEACSGMNSLIGLTAVMTFYIYVIHRASLRYSLVLGAAIIPIAIFVNILRIMTLILLTYYEGDAVAQGFLHKTTGVVLFALALAFTILFDKALSMVFARRGKSGKVTANG